MKYELTLILDGKATPAKKKKTVDGLKETIAALGGKIIKSEDWGVKELTYRIKKSGSGLYLFFELELDAVKVKSLNEKLRAESGLLRYLLVAAD